MDSVNNVTVNGNTHDGKESGRKTKPADTDPPVASFQIASTRINQNFIIVWLDHILSEVDNGACLGIVTRLREVVNSVQIFPDVDACLDFISDTEEEKILMISCGVFSQTIVPIVHNMPQLHAIYIFCSQKTPHEQWIDEWSKIQGVFTDIDSVCEAVKHGAEVCDQNSVTVSFVKTTDRVANKTLDELDQAFVFIQVLKEILPDIEFSKAHLHDFLTYCREEIFVDNDIELYNIDRMEEEYDLYPPIWWYMSNCFLSSMINRILRTMEMDLVMKIGFFLRGLQQHIMDLHTEQFGEQNRSSSYTVYRGQGLSQSDFDQLKDTQGGLVMFNNFMLTTLDRASSLELAKRNGKEADAIGVVFEITINLSTSSTSFVNVQDERDDRNEPKMLFALHSAFRIGQIKEIEEENHRLWQVSLTLTNSNNLQLHSLTELIHKETQSSQKGWSRLGDLMVKLGKFYEAEQVFEHMIQHTVDQVEKAKLYHTLGSALHNQDKHSEAVESFLKSIEINERLLPPTHTDLAISYSSIGSAYNSMSEYSQALTYYEKALDICQKTLPEDHLDLATCYNNCGEVYNNLTIYIEALLHHTKALSIRQEALPPNHPDIAASYNNIGAVYNAMGDYSKALSTHKKALEIRQEALPPIHIDLAMSYKNIGEVYSNMQAYSEALLYHQKAIDIEQKIFPPCHHSLALSYNNIGGVYDELNEHLKALWNYEKALEIFEEILPPNHPSFAISYNNIAGVYSAMEDYPQALLYYKKALEVSHKTLPANHPYFAPLYGHIGMVYAHTEDHPTALVYYERALELSQHSLPSNHPHLKLYQDGIEYIKKNL